MLGGSVVHLRFQGAFQWHGKSDPVNAETCSCAGQHQGGENSPVTELVRIRLEPAVRCVRESESILGIGYDFPGESLGSPESRKPLSFQDTGLPVLCAV